MDPAYLTLGILALMMALLSFSKIAPDLIFLTALALLLVFGVINPKQALVGFSNESVATVAVLYVVVAGLRDTGGIAWLSKKLLSKPRSLMQAQLKLMIPVTILSAFMNNTPVVAMLIPAVKDWSKKYDLAVSKLMLPLSYAAILGGGLSLIGTSTNLLVNGLLLEKSADYALGIFDIAMVGLPTAIVAIAFIAFSSRWLLPDRSSAIEHLANPKEYSVEMLVDASGPLPGQTVESAGLRHLSGLYLMEIERKGKIFPAVSPNHILEAGDRLVFIGITDSVLELQKIRGLLPATEQLFKLDSPRSKRILIEAVVAHTSPFVNRGVRESRFRSVYNAVIIAVARNGERIKEKKIGDIILRAGDTLMLETRPSFVEQHKDSKDFYLVSAVKRSSPLRFDRIYTALAILMLMVIAVSLNLLPIFVAALIAAILMVASGAIRAGTARKSISWSVIIVIAAAFGIGNAMQVSGAANLIASQLTAFAGSSAIANLIAIYAVTAFFSSIISNNAAAVLMFPIAWSISSKLGLSIMPFAIAIMMAASASFATPIGYQTNLMVYGPGGYRFRDYLKIGIPLNIVCAIVALLIIPLIWKF